MKVDAPIMARLRSESLSIAAIAEDSPGTTDDDVLSEANQQQASLLTCDTDFGELVFRMGRTTSGVLLLRLAGLAMAAKCNLVSKAIRDHQHEMIGAFTVITPGAIRIRKQP